ncbi:pyridoxal phosphate-dependent aminotransferase family protein [Campylobacter sp. MIT 21-1685]|uniref:aminotransferase class I/II-fold pyridoxal phosphate-dependent enzyme n=1 Tax=unclassified Campylobacter TaxID=2593542 RepID=UPI00224A789B|nr:MULTISPECIES: pyridoxal phosphate-dependent aminotransferase family protein [unclassified Campylobacter]MCX2683043.1 pyridoxal phosphate-dependent aminotransferase family protein [Campylobacter sp. MIT 21-1684]MCX2751325.1 pyridoxal phosphate-dependent aminotransferase family protein [Campylobacter sp. MIT 21-1682]MCX2807524.1 pyridoxal phosphate-dependent aminotransferase family protein [Campylobacter sp. MIT 21-1685]
MKQILENLKKENNYRFLKTIQYEGKYVLYQGKKVLNLAGNDYLNIAKNENLREEFFRQIQKKDFFLSSSSSRSLSGNCSVYEKFENDLAQKMNKTNPHSLKQMKSKDTKEVLHFNSGYQLNLSCIQALGTLANTLFIADKSIHASVIDGLRLSTSTFVRFRHNDMSHLESLLQQHYKKYENIILISEALFSMDGDFTKLKKLIEFKKQYKNILLYIDEAHSVGCFDESGLGFARYLGLDQEIDFLVFTFGKALASTGACIITKKEFKEFFINKARAFIYSTALPPLNVAWTHFIFEKLSTFTQQRHNLQEKSQFLKNTLLQNGFEVLGQAHIISLMCKSNEKADELANRILQCGIFAPAIKVPSVAKNTARIRFSLHCDLDEEDLEKIVKSLLQ